LELCELLLLIVNMSRNLSAGSAVHTQDNDDVSIVSTASGTSGFVSQSEAPSNYDDNDYSDEEEEEEEEEKDKLPAHACMYCHISDPECVVKCIDTGKWFCNGRGNTSAAHIVQHLVLSGKKSVSLHPEGPLGETVLECYSCGQKNAFNIGCVPSLSTHVMALLCRECSPNNGTLDDLDWDPSAWKPVIQDKAFVEWLAKVPKEKVQIAAENITSVQIGQLEKAWRDNPAATLLDIERKEFQTGQSEEAIRVRLDYEDGYAYQNVMAPLVMLESEENRRMKEVVNIEGVEVEWDDTHGKQIAKFALKGDFMTDGSDSRLVVGDELALRLDLATITAALTRPPKRDKNGPSNIIHSSAGVVDTKMMETLKVNGDGWEGVGYVVKIQDNEVQLEMRSKKVPDMVTKEFTVVFVWKGVSYERMQTALKNLAINDLSVSGYLYHHLMGHPNIPDQRIKVDIPADLRVPMKMYQKYEYRELNKVNGAEEIKIGVREVMEQTDSPNPSQAEAIRFALSSPLSLIQGPPGTGKTFTSTCIVWHLSQQHLGQILVCAPSNVAVDHLTEKIARTGLKVVRLAAKSREETATNDAVEKVSLHNIVNNLSGPTWDKFRKLRILKEDQGGLNAKDAKNFQRMREEAEKEVLGNADVICCTCAGAGDKRIEKLRFRQVLIDESTQAMEAECLIPIVHGAKQVVLVGDHQQLGPVVMSKEAGKAGLTQSLFERLVMLGHRPMRLTIQYRMHPVLSEWPSNTFYEGTLTNGKSAYDCENPAVEMPFLPHDMPMLFHISSGGEELAGNGTSYINQKEAEVVERIVTALMKGSALPSEIGIITPYEGQRAYVKSYIHRNGGMTKKELYEEIEVASVDAFQGREKDYIILSCVRSNDNQGIGFLKDPRRLNVALTRARYGVFIVGNPNVLARNALWHSLLKHFQDRSALKEGASLASLRISDVMLPPARGNRAQGDNDRGRGYQYAGMTSSANQGQREGWDGQGQGEGRDRYEQYQRGWSDTVQEFEFGYAGYGGPGLGGSAGGGPALEVALNRKDSRYDKQYGDTASHVSGSEGSYRTQNRSFKRSAQSSVLAGDDDHSITSDMTGDQSYATNA